MEYQLKQPALPQYSAHYLEDVLKARGVHNIEEFLEPHSSSRLTPYLLDNISAAAEIITSMMQRRAKTAFVVDCDFDGVASSAILWLYLKATFGDVDFSFIMHSGKQHGLKDVMDQLLPSDYEFIIVPDAGSNDYEQHEALAAAGKTVLVIDHHQAEHYSPYALVVNNQLSPNYPNKTLCGAAMVLKVCEVLDEAYDQTLAEDFYDLAACALIADVMDMRAVETRYYIMAGLQRLRNKGLIALLNAQSYSIPDMGHLTPTDIAFYIAPLINSIMRVGTMREKEGLFLAFIDPDRKLQSTKRGASLDDVETAAEQNARVAKNVRARQNKIVEKTTEDIVSMIYKEGLLDNKILIIEVDDEVPPEIRGLVAAHIMDRFHRPALIVRRNEDGVLKGSLRGSDTFEGVPNTKAFLEESALVNLVAGHANAAGVELSAKNAKSLIHYANDHIKGEMASCYQVDYVFESSQSIYQPAKDFAEAADCWGNSVDEPSIVIENIVLNHSDILPMGQNKDTFKFLHGEVAFLRFKDAEFGDALRACQLPQITVYGKFSKNVFNNRTTYQFIIKDYEITDAVNDF